MRVDASANLKEQRALAARILEATGGAGPIEEMGRIEEILACADELAARVKELDEWIMRSGFLPEAWRLALMARVDDDISRSGG
jgi:hypothetical protein